MLKIRPVTPICRFSTFSFHSVNAWFSSEPKSFRKPASFCLSARPSRWPPQSFPSTSSTRFMYSVSCRSICFTQMMSDDTGGKSRTSDMRAFIVLANCTLNFVWRWSMSAFTRSMSWVWYSRMAPLIFGRTNSALNFLKIRNISFAFLALLSWSFSLAMIRISTVSILSEYRFWTACHARTPTSVRSNASTISTSLYAKLTSSMALASSASWTPAASSCDVGRSTRPITFRSWSCCLRKLPSSSSRFLSVSCCGFTRRNVLTPSSRRECRLMSSRRMFRYISSSSSHVLKTRLQPEMIRSKSSSRACIRRWLPSIFSSRSFKSREIAETSLSARATGYLVFRIFFKCENTSMTAVRSSSVSWAFSNVSMHFGKSFINGL